MTSFLELATARRSVRSYTDRTIPESTLDYVMEAARLAPSACNLKPWSFILVKDEVEKGLLQATYPRDWFKSAPMYIIACADHSRSWKRQSDNKDHADIDLAIAIQHICLAAAEQGLGTCWVCNFDPILCKSSFNIPEHIEPIAIIPIGYPSC